MKLPKMPFSIQALVLANIMPLIGILFFGWDAAVIVLLYWTENIVIGFYNILKMTLLKLSFDPGKLFAIPFFCLHFGGFCAVHGFFLLAFFKLGGGIESFFPKEAWPGLLVFMQLLVAVVSSLWRNHPVGMEWPVIGLFASHGISFVQNYLLKKEYASLTIAKLMNQPYKRIVILHVTIIAGGVPIMLIGSPVPLMCILVLLKVSMDIYLHKKEHKVNIDEKIKPSNPLDSEIAA